MKITKTQEKDLIVYTVKANNTTHSFAHPVDVNIDPLDVVNILLDMVDKNKSIVNITSSSGTTFRFPTEYFNSPSIPNPYYNPYPITCSNTLTNDPLS